MCTCSDPDVYFWNGTYCCKKFSYLSINLTFNIFCFFKANVQSINGSCSINAGCKPFQNLFCNASEQFPNTCQCLPYNYWSVSSQTCVAQKSNGDLCSALNECLSFSGLFCSTTCQCKSNYYWSSALVVCVKKATYGEQCSASNYDNTLNLVCGGNGYTVCPVSTFWNGSYCGK